MSLLSRPALLAPTRSRSRLRRVVDDLGGWVVAVLAVVAVLSLLRTFGPLTYPGDIWRQSDTATIARNFARNGMDLFLPQIDWGGAGPGYVETELPLLPWLTGGLYLVFGEHPSLGRLVSLAFTAVAVAGFWTLARRILPRPAARWALVAFAVSPVVMRWGSAFMPDAGALAFSVLALAAFARWIERDRTRDLAATAAFLSVAALVKPTALHTALVMAVWLLLTRRERFRRPALYVAGVAALVAPALWVWHAARLHAEYGNTFGVISGGDSKWGSVSLWLTPDFYLGIAKAEVLFVYGIAGVPLAIAGVVWLVRHRRRYAGTLAFLGAAVIGLGAYYAAAGRYTSTDLGLQYHAYALPYAATAVGAGAAWVLGWVRRRWVAPAALVLVLALAAQSGFVWARSFEDGSGALGTCATVLDRVSQPGDLAVVGTTSRSVVGGVTNNYQEPVIFFRADRKGWSLPADRYLPGLLESYRDQGARWFVNPDPALLRPGSPLAVWLAAHATPVASPGCGVWSLAAPPP